VNQVCQKERGWFQWQDERFALIVAPRTIPFLFDYRDSNRWEVEFISAKAISNPVVPSGYFPVSYDETFPVHGSFDWIGDGFRLRFRF